MFYHLVEKPTLALLRPVLFTCPLSLKSQFISVRTLGLTTLIIFSLGWNLPPGSTQLHPHHVHHHQQRMMLAQQQQRLSAPITSPTFSTSPRKPQPSTNQQQQTVRSNPPPAATETNSIEVLFQVRFTHFYVYYCMF